MKTINKQVNNFKQLDSFSKFQLVTFSVIMLSLASVIVQWGLNGFATMAM